MFGHCGAPLMHRSGTCRNPALYHGRFCRDHDPDLGPEYRAARARKMKLGWKLRKRTQRDRSRPVTSLQALQLQRWGVVDALEALT